MREIFGYEGLYSITEDGRVWSHHSKRFLKPIEQAKTHYLKVNLSKEGKVEVKYVHRLVAETYIPNPDPQTLKEVDHIDRNRQNNVVSNLRWVSRTENMRNRKDTRKVVNLNTQEVFNSLPDAAESVKQAKNFHSACSSIQKCCYGKSKTAYGIRWQFYEDQKCVL